MDDDPTDYPKYLAANWEIRIGNSPIWSENPKCNQVTLLSSTYMDVFSDANNINKDVPAFGFREECNMLGTYTFFTAYVFPTESVTVCDAAVIGTAYVRDEAIPAIFEVHAGSSATSIVPHVHAKDIIGNVLAIDLRVADDSDFTSVQLTNGAAANEVLVDATSLAMGTTYTLKLESFD